MKKPCSMTDFTFWYILLIKERYLFELSFLTAYPTLRTEWPVAPVPFINCNSIDWKANDALVSVFNCCIMQRIFCLPFFIKNSYNLTSIQVIPLLFITKIITRFLWKVHLPQPALFRECISDKRNSWSTEF